MTNRSSSFSELAVGRFRPGDSPLHQAPAAGKAVLLGALGVAGFWLQSAAAFAAIGLALAALAWLARLPQGVFWRSLRPLLLLAALTVTAGAFLHPPVGTLTDPQFSWAGLHKGALYAARLLLITLLTTLFFLTTPPDDAISLGMRLLAPLRLLGIESRELSLLVHLAYRFMPLLVRELEEMRWGRLARNLPATAGPLAGPKDAVDSLVSVVISALHRAETTAVAIEQRGLLDHWTPAPLRSGRWSQLWPLLATCALVGLLLSQDAYLW
jgi:energy-coupling factor transporter transmembrane protein EcfT